MYSSLKQTSSHDTDTPRMSFYKDYSAPVVQKRREEKRREEKRREEKRKKEREKRREKKEKRTNG